jgi:diguanylate cyclase (GGDEF)-like protein
MTPKFLAALERDSADLLYGNAFSGILVSVIASSFLVLSFDSVNAHSFKLFWLVAMITLMGIRYLDVYRWNVRFKNTDYDGAAAISRFICGVNATALMWAAYAVYVIQFSPLIEQTTIIVIVSAMAGGSATVLAAHKRTAMLYVFLLLAPASVCLLLSSEYVDQVLGILGASFTFVMLAISSKSADFTRHAITLKNENAALVEHMEKEVELRTQRIYELSNKDPLTGLYNRTAFSKHLNEALIRLGKEGQELALLFIDLDGFKKINDTFGHEAGDQILEASAGRLKSFTHNSHLLCRWGGDEFLVAFERTGQDDAIRQGQKIIEKLSQEHITADAKLSVGATVGIALFPLHETCETKLIQYADTAMYHQKKFKGSSVCVFAEEMEAEHLRELKLKNGLSKAIEKKELRIVFQPIVSPDRGVPVAFEALLRWQHGDENIPPDQFIGIAEQYGLILSIGEWVMFEACRAAVAWQAFRDLPVCVNVSVIQFQDSGFPEMVDRAIRASGLSPDCLHLEITESVFASDVKLLRRRIKAMQQRGIHVSIDDFGTGYSSLSVMQDLAVNTVKIDRSFINNLEGSGIAIVTAVIHAASIMKFDVVAEGVETEAQYRKLSKLGVHKLQGFYFSKPMEIEVLNAYLESKLSK